ncbi:MAG: hypothetical protein HOF21_05680 [Nitrospina sp.]|jgi:hypothetical protein|nr:hypothetical protein [Nitrospina sp.]MBT5632093.1 hypothetical protein [Nitrospina sp.]
MANTTVITTIVVRFDDQFTAQAKQASEKSKKSLEEVLKTGKETENIFKSISKQKMEAIALNEKLLQGANREIDTFVRDLEDSFLEESNFEKGETVATFTSFIVALHQVMVPATIALAAFYATWKASQTLEEWLVGGQPIGEHLEGVKESAEQLADLEAIALPPIPEETVQSLQTTKTCLEQIQALQDIFITVNLVDNATQEAKRIREEIEETFSQDIVQRVKIIEETVKTSLGSRDKDSFFDGGPEFVTSSTDLTGFSSSVGSSPPKIPKIPGFASGIDRVPRDMLAMIHKDEAVLPKNQAEDFRKGGSRGITLQNLNVSFNLPNTFNFQGLDREQFRNFAFKLMGEMKRLDQRVN